MKIDERARIIQIQFDFMPGDLDISKMNEYVCASQNLNAIVTQ